VVASALTFLTPLGALVASAAVLPLAALAVATRRGERATRLLGLEPVRRGVLGVPGRLWLPAVLATCVCAFLGLAAAQPAWRTTHRQVVRTHSQVFFVVDVSRSMAAAGSFRARTRLERARSDVAALRAAVPDVPSGLAGLTDRVLPYLFPTPHVPAFADTLRSSVVLESPPPQQVSTNATSFDALASLAGQRFFDPSADRRTCVVVSDGETRSYSISTVARALAGPRGCRLLVVHVGGADERVFGVNGAPEAGYAPDPAATAKAQQLAEAAGGQAFGEGELGAASAALRSAAEVGPVRREAAGVANRSLSPYAAGIALALTLALAAFRARRPWLRAIRTFA
jgi:hypothetical protein